MSHRRAFMLYGLLYPRYHTSWSTHRRATLIVKVFKMSSLLNFHVCWYAHFILILLTQTAGDTSVNKKAANHVCFWFGFFKLLMISAVYNSKLLQILSFTLIEADHQHLILVYCHRYKLKPYYMMPNVIS